MSMHKDILCIPAKAFIRGCKPYSLILSMATIKDFNFYWKHTDSCWSMDKGYYLHFSQKKCCDKNCNRTAVFKKSKVLTVNRCTGKYMWRKPYSEELP